MAPLSKSTSQDEAVGVAYVLPPGTNQTTEEGHFVMVNGTLIHILLKRPFKDSDLNELLYVIIVIVFYATALMTLIITQIRRQRREGTDVDYYDEYLQRNQEVKRACQTATTLVLKKGKSKKGGGGGGKGGAAAGPAVSPSIPVVVGGGIGGGAAAAGGGVGGGGGGLSTPLLEPPGRTRDLSPHSAHRMPYHGRGGGGGVTLGSSSSPGCASDDNFTYTPSVSPRELSPMLESIPDIGT